MLIQPNKYPKLSTLLSKYPQGAGCLFQTYNDILFGILLFRLPRTRDLLLFGSSAMV